MRKLFLLLFVVTTAVLFSASATACATARRAPTPAPVTLDFSALDTFGYAPATAEVQSGVAVTIQFANTGVLDHSWMLTRADVDVTAVREEDALAGTSSGVIRGGETKTFAFTAPPPGQYKVVCTVPGHAAAGMVADFSVTP